MTWKLLLLAACGVLTGAVIRSLSFGKPEQTTVEHKRDWLKEEETRRRNAFSALGTEGDRFVA